MTEEWKFTPGWPGLQSLTLVLVSLTDQDRSFGQFHSRSLSLFLIHSLSHTHVRARSGKNGEAAKDRL